MNSLVVPASLEKAHRLSIAPMMDWTDRHCRFFLRLMSPSMLLYTEMVTAAALLHGRPEPLLAFNKEELPLALQLGGDDPQALARCARMGEEAGYSEINLNVGCPSERVRSGRFGACLMRTPSLVGDMVSAMKSRVRIPVTVKHRLGVDELDRYEDLERFVQEVRLSGCDAFIVHARKAWLTGMSPKDNRERPPLRYSDVYRLKARLPGLRIELNGGVKSLPEVTSHLTQVDGVMIGRAAYHNPYLLASAERDIFGHLDYEIPTRDDLVYRIIPYAEQLLAEGERISRLSRHMLGLYHGTPSARLWRRSLSLEAARPDASAKILLEALGAMKRAKETAQTKDRGRTSPVDVASFSEA